MSASESNRSRTEWITILQAGIGCLGTVAAALIAGFFTLSTVVMPYLFPTASAVQPAQPTVTPTTVPEASINFVTRAVMLKDLRNESYAPEFVTEEFPADQSIFYLWLDVEKAPKDTVVRVVWNTDADIEMAHFSQVVEGSDHRDYWFKPDGGKLAPGKYHVQVFINGKLNRTIPFTVASAQVTTNGRPANWRLLFSEDFKTKARGWNVDDEQPHTDQYGVFDERLGGGKLTISAKATNPVISRYVPTFGALTDQYITVQAQQTAGSVDAPYGIVFRLDGNANYFAFLVQENGKFGVYRKETTWTTLVAWTNTSAIKKDRANQLAILAQGARLSFYVNGQQVAQAEDARLPTGQSGVVVELLNKGDQANFEFSDYAVWGP